MSTYIIAEAGSCGEGRRWQMHRLIDVAAECGADAIKFQWTSDAQAIADRRRAPDYAEHYRQGLQWPEAWFDELSTHARDVGVDFMCTVYLVLDIAVVSHFVSAFKIASFEARDAVFLRAHTRDEVGHRPIYLSTGMMTGEDASTVAATLNPTQDWRLLHCVSAYPAPRTQLTIGVCREEWCWGVSDHSEKAQTHAGALAVAAGAHALEVHFCTGDEDPCNRDAQHARTPADLRAYVQAVRAAEVACGAIKVVQPCESAMSEYRVGVSAS